MGGTMMDSTRRSLAGAIQDARGGRGSNSGPKNPGAKYFGGWEGGSGGTFGKAARAVGEPRPQQKNHQRSSDPLGPSQAHNSPIGGFSQHTGRRQRIRPNSAGAQSIWNSTSVGQLPKAPPPGTSPRIAPRPSTAQPPSNSGKAANVPPRSPASRPKGPPAFTDPFRSATLSHASRDPFSIMATLQQGMTFDTKDMHASHALHPPESHPQVSAPHEHVTKPCVVHPPSPPSFSPPPVHPDPSIGEHDANSRAREQWEGAEPGDPEKVTMHPSAGANLKTLASIDENHSTGGKGGTLRQQLSQAATVTPKRVQQIVKAMRAALKRRATLYRTKQMQLDALMSQEGDGMGQVAVDGLSRLAMCLGVDITHPEAIAFCTHHGFTSLAVPNDALCSLLLANSSSKATSEAPTKRQPFSRTAAPTVANCKINYRPCKTPVYTPTEWPRTGESIVERSAQLPDARLILDFVYGYAGFNNTSCNLFYNCNRQVLYYVAGVAIVYTPPADSTDGSGAPVGHTQNYFLGHDDDIKSLALCPSTVQVDNRSFPANSIAATGQVCSTSHGPYICVWDSAGYGDGIDDREGSYAIGVEEIRKIELEKSYRGVGALGFSPDGRFLVAVALDNVHSVMVFDWRTGTTLCEGRGFAGEPPQVYGLTWNPHVKDPSDFHFVTWGKKHCKLWSRSQNSVTVKPGSFHKDKSLQFTSKQLSFGRFDLQNVHSAVFLPQTHAMVLGLARGDLLVFSGTSAVRSVSAHRSGPQFIADDGSVTFSGLRGLALHHGDSCLLTAGADGKICTWNVQDGTLDDSSLQSTLQLQPQYGGAAKAPVVRALCVSPLDKDIMVGTSACDIWEEVLMFGHGGSMHAVAWHPVRTSVFATACDAHRVFVFDATARSTIKTAATNMASRAVAWSCQPMRDGIMHHLALGGTGRILVLDEEALQPICEVRDSGHAINDLKYNPQSTVLAAACADRHVYLYTVGFKRYSRVAKCSGHSASVRALDWRIDGQVLQSVCAACELLRWSGNTGRQITECQRDSEWATWTCNLGFPVMGIWYEGSDPTDINAVSRDSSGRFLATADDRGLVRLLNYPVVVSEAPSRGYVGHSAHVTCVRFSEPSNSIDSSIRSHGEGSDMAWVATCGGGDRAVFQFKLEEIKEEEEPAVEDPEPVWGPLDPQGKVFGWTKPEPSCHSAAHGVTSSPKTLLPGQKTAQIEEAVSEEVQSDEGDGSDDAGGWGDV